MKKTHSVIAVAMVLTLALGTLNSLIKTNKVPKFRFYFGSGALYLFLTVMAEFEDELAKAIAIAIATFVVLGEGGGVLDHFLGSGASNGILDTRPSPRPTGGSTVPPAVAQSTRRNTGRNAAGPIHTLPIKPATAR